MGTTKPTTDLCDQISELFGGTEHQKYLRSRCIKYSKPKPKSESISNSSTTMPTSCQSNKCKCHSMSRIMARKTKKHLKFKESKSRYLPCDYLDKEARKHRILQSFILRGKKIKDKIVAAATLSSPKYNETRTAVIYLTIFIALLSSFSIINCQISTRSADNQGK